MYHEFRDPIHGFITLEDHEIHIVDSRPFQRLRNIKQLGTTYLVYPSANHTRFEHSLGTLQVASEIFDHLVKSYPEEFERWNKDEKDGYHRLIRLAALLHDIGHAPFSHSSESLMPIESGEKYDHEKYTRETITNLDEIAQKIQDVGLDPRDVAAIATGKTTEPEHDFLSDLLTGELGADRIDYLLRDSYHLGVIYGKFDYPRLLQTLVVQKMPTEEGGGERPSIAIEEGGVHAAEALFFARYWMFLQVYFHKTRRILDGHLTDFLKDHLKDGTYPSSIGDFLQWDDLRVLGLLTGKSDTMHYDRLLKRHHFREVDSTTDHPEGREVKEFYQLGKG